MAQRIVRYKGHFYDMGTSNKSFLQVASDLKKLGVENCYFMLEIFDYTLVNVNPHVIDEKTGKTILTKDQISRVLTECARNPWYFLREIVRITESGSSTGVPYIANRGNIAQAWCILHNLDSWLCLPRQQGKTMSALALELWIYHFGTKNSTFIFINKDGDNAKENLRRVGNLIDALPEYMRFEYIMTDEGKIEKGKKNATQYEHAINGNKIITKARATSSDTAMSIARGLTAALLHFDEPEFTPFIDIIIKNSVSTFETAHRKSLANNSISARIFTCTPGDLSSKPGQAAVEILDGTIKWHDSFYDKSVSEILKMIEKNRSNGILYIEYQYYQIGLTNAWLRNISNKIGDPLTVRREILLQRLHGSNLSPYPREDIEYIASTKREPIDEIFILSYYRFDIYEELKKNIPYIVGIDCSTGTVKDNNAITALNPYTLKPAAEFKCPYIGETLFEELIESFVLNYVPRAIVCIERNHVGDGIIDHLLNKSKIANRLYYDKDRDLVQARMKEASTVESMLKAKATLKSYYGVYTEGKSREDMFTILSRHVNERKDDFVTKNIIEDISGLVRTSSGKIEAGPGGHDDSVMSYLIALYVYYHGNNLASFGFYRTNEYEGSELNTGINRPDISEILPQEVIDKFEREKEIEDKLSYESMYRKAVLENQKTSYNLSRSKIMKSNNYLDSTPEEIFYDEDNTTDDDFDMSLFDELNGF